MRMNISVPNALAAEVREYSLPISEICQRALRAEVAQRRPCDGDYDLVVTVRVYGGSSAEGVALALENHEGTFDVPGGEAEIIRVRLVSAS